MSIFGDTSRVIDNPSTEAVLALEAEGSMDYEAYRPHAVVLQQSAEDGDWTATDVDRAICGLGRRYQLMEQIIDGIMEEAIAARDRPTDAGKDILMAQDINSPDYTIGVIGTGTMGRGIAQISVVGGYKVRNT